MNIGDLVRYCTDPTDGRLGIVVSEVFDTRPKWHAEYPAVQVRARHALAPDEEGIYIWQLEDIEVVSSVDGTI